MLTYAWGQFHLCCKQTTKFINRICGFDLEHCLDSLSLARSSYQLDLGKKSGERLHTSREAKIIDNVKTPSFIAP